MTRNLENSLHSVSSADSDRFVQLVEASQLDRSYDFQNADLTNMIFDGEVLYGFDFSGADFRGSSLNKTIFKNSIIDNAIFDQDAEIYADDNLPINPNLKESQNIIDLVNDLSISTLATDRIRIFKELLEIGKSQNIRKYVRQKVVNDRSISVSKSLRKFISSGDNESNFQFFLEILSGENGRRHSRNAFYEAFSYSSKNTTNRNILLHYATENISSISENIGRLDLDDHALNFISAHIKSKSVSNGQVVQEVLLLKNLCTNDKTAEFARDILRFSIDIGSQSSHRLRPMWQSASLLDAFYFSNDDRRIIAGKIKKTLEQSSTLVQEVRYLFGLHEIVKFNLSSEIWEWFLCSYAPTDRYGRGISSYELYPIIASPYLYETTHINLLKVISELREKSTNPDKIESMLRSHFEKFEEFEDIVDVLKSRLFGTKYQPKYEAYFSEDEPDDDSDDLENYEY